MFYLIGRELKKKNTEYMNAFYDQEGKKITFF